MADFTFQLPAGIDPLTVDAARVDDYFGKHGYTVLDGSSVMANGTVLVHLDRNPSADAPAFANQLTAQEQNVAAAVSYLKNTYVPAVLAIAPVSRTPEQRALLAMTIILKQALQQ